MPKTPATPRTTRNSRGLRQSTPTTDRSSRESSVASDDNDNNNPSPTPLRRTRRSRSRSLEPTTDAAAAPTSSKTTSTPTKPQTQLPLPPVPESIPATPQSTGTSSRILQGARAAATLTPIIEESPVTATSVTKEVPAADTPVPTTSIQEIPDSIAPSLSPTVDKPTGPISLQPATPRRYQFETTDEVLQAQIRAVEGIDIGDFLLSLCSTPSKNPHQKQLHSDRRRKKLAYRREHQQQVCREWSLPADPLERTPDLIVGEEPAQSTEKYISLKKEEGHAFGARLLRAIKADHEQRGCECPLPQIYKSKAEAEAGEGTFRFFHHRKLETGNIWVFMRKDDWRWHCTCEKKPLSDFAVWVRKYKATECAQHENQALKAEEQSRKRKAEDSELELTNPVTLRVVDGPPQPTDSAIRRRVVLLASSSAQSARSLASAQSARLVRSAELAGSLASAESARLVRSARLARSNLSRQSALSMWRALGTTAIIMGSTVKHFLSRVGAQISQLRQPQVAVETRSNDATGTHVVVKRLKRQHYVPIKPPTPEEAKEPEPRFPPPQSYEPSPFDDYPWFEWTDSPAKYIGEEHLIYFRNGAIGTLLGLQKGQYHWAESAEALKQAHDEITKAVAAGTALEDQIFNLDLSLCLREWALRKHGGLTDEAKKKTIKEVEQRAESLKHIIEDLYASETLIPDLKQRFGPRPPKSMANWCDWDVRRYVKGARDFLNYLLTIDDNREEEDVKTAISKFIIDLDAIHKQEIPMSFVEFPGKTGEDIMPGSFPLGLLEEVREDNLEIVSIFDVQFPEKAAPAPAPSQSPPRLPAKEPGRGITKPPRYLPPPKEPMPGDKPRVPVLRFAKNLVQFQSPQHKAPHYRVEKPRPRASRKTRNLWERWSCELYGGHIHSLRGYHNVMPLDRPEDQTMEEAGGWRMVTNPMTEETKRAVPPTKYESFLDETRQELFERGWVIGPTTKGPQPPYDGTMVKASAPAEEVHDISTTDAPASAERVAQGITPDGPHRLALAHLAQPEAPKPAKTMREVEQEREFLLADLQVANGGELVRPGFLLPDSELVIATKKLDDLHLVRQLREEERAAAERAKIELARKLEEEKRRREAEEREKAELERRRREAEKRRQEQEEHRAREAAAARKREEERVREAARIRDQRMGLRRPERAIIRPLSEAFKSRVSEAQRTAEGIELAKTPDGTVLTKRDFAEKLLPERAWLNDNVIIGSIQHIGSYVNQKASATKENPRCATFTSYFWPRLDSAGPTKVARMMKLAGVRKDNFRDIESILIPICSGAHWTLAAVFPQKRKVLHMDSLRGGHGNPAVTAKILDWIKVTLGELFVESEWSAVDLDGPMQNNGWDCGVFTITNGLCMALGLDPKESYAAGQLKTARAMLAGVLLNGGFRGEFDLVGV